MDDFERNVAISELKKVGINFPFILFVGTLEPRKNLRNLLRVFSMLKGKKKFNGKLVVVGMPGWMQDDLVEKIRSFGVLEDVVLMGYISDVQLRYLYNLAEVFVFPSIYEGFGFPILEALCCGGKVVCSNASSCPEIAQDAALLVNPHQEQDIEQAIEQILDDKELSGNLKQKAVERAKDFSFLKTATETLAVYKELAS